MRLQWIVIVLMAMIVSACSTNPESTVAFADLPETGDPVAGEAVYNSQNCGACHIEGASGAPWLEGLGERAGSTVEGESAREYVFYAVVQPARHIVEGYGNAMPNNYDEQLNAQELADLVSYLLEW
ncbi:MAG: c-type cytochrome [Chloroflexota bacterium]